MFREKTIADVLTVARFLIGVYLFWLGSLGERATLSLAASLLWLAWVTDVLDGPIARRSPIPTISRIGRHDLHADMTVTAGTWGYLWLSGFIGTSLAFIVAVLAILLIWYTRSIHVCSAVQATSYGTMLYTCFANAPFYGWALVSWLALVVGVTWPRFPQKASEFLHGIASLIRQ
ncbi:MAG: hypothetical protein D6775_03605 [Caldilineae bacterium]|nr:MAG: hypothetical protein D6775_03605 [Caldilineae bacterium]